MPRPEDLEHSEEDYVMGPGDLLRISILDLFQEGIEHLVERQISQTGHIQLPLLSGRIKATGLTVEELTEEIKNAYKPDILKDPTVSVMAVVRRQDIFSILGAIAAPGTSSRPRRDFTLLEALALAGDVTQTSIEWVYVIRPKKRPPRAAPPPTGAEEELPPLPTLPSTTKPGPTLEQQLRELEQFIPGAFLDPRGTPRRPPGSDERILLSSVGSSPASASDTAPSGPGAGPSGFRWIYSNKRWIRVPEGSAPAVLPSSPPPEAAPRVAPVPTPPVRPAEPVTPTGEDPFGWRQYDMSGLARIIAVNLPNLRNGNPRMNIKIRKNDIVHIPPLKLGEFYVMGEVLRPGAYTLTGRRVTAKQAVAAAGNLGVLSWPNNSILIRRVGRDQEQVIPLPLNEIFAGRENDIYLKPDDVIAVGTHWAAPFLAVWRNAFRMTYGFGFIYDRNYSERDFEVPIFYPKPGVRPFVSD